MNRTWRRLLIFLVTATAFVVLPLYGYKVYLKVDYTDFFVYYRTATRLKDHIYDLVYTLRDGTSPFRYLPILLPFFRPFAELPLRSAQLLWYFCQFFWFAAGFFVLHRTARLISPRELDPDCALIASCLTLFFILRFCLDTFTIGQVSSLMFLGYCVAFYGFVAEKAFVSGSGLAIPTLFKIGPGFSYLLYLFSGADRCIRAWLAPLIWSVALTLITFLMIGNWSTLLQFGSGWMQNVAKDDSYYDASHYGSQALKSALLRLVNSGWLSNPHAYLTWGIVTILGCSFILWIWATRRARTPEGRGLLFSIGIFPYLWFMPETFKYSLTMLALPMLMLLLSKERTKLRLVALVACFIFLSAAGKDFLPDAVFFGLQRASIPFLTTLLIAASVLQLLWRHTIRWNEQPERLPRPWEQLPFEAKTDGISVLIPLGLHPPGRASLGVITELENVLRRRFGNQWELIWIAPADSAKTQELLRKFPQSKLVLSSELGRGYCLREGFLHSAGKWIYLYRLEQPVSPAFLSMAMDRLGDATQTTGQAPVQLVRANRRDPETRFLIPVRHLSVAYGRHRLGLIFNRLVHLLLPAVTTSDTHSGHVILTREAASEIFALQTSGDFLFDLELCVTAKAHRYRESELPVELYLFEEKSSGRVFAEILAILTGLPKLRLRFQRGCYAPLKKTDAITADDWGLSPAVNRGILELAQKG